MPLWFAVPPDDPFRVENAIDDFMTRTTLGLEDVRRRVLRRRDCPFRKVVVVWDTTPQALSEWREGRSALYEDAANASLENPVGASLWSVLSDGLKEAISKTAIPESEAPSMSLHVRVEARKKASGTGPYPEFVEAHGEVLRERNERPVGRWSSLKAMVALTLWKLLCIVRIHGVEGLERWIATKLSVSHAWRRSSARKLITRPARGDRSRAPRPAVPPCARAGGGCGPDHRRERLLDAYPEFRHVDLRVGPDCRADGPGERSCPAIASGRRRPNWMRSSRRPEMERPPASAQRPSWALGRQDDLVQFVLTLLEGARCCLCVDCSRHEPSGSPEGSFLSFVFK